MRFGKGLWACAAPPVAVVALGLLAGCGGGGGIGTVNPVATPSPSASAILGVIASQTNTVPSSAGNVPIVKVQWSALPSTPITNIVAYKVFRNDVIVGVTARTQTSFYDTVQTDFSGTFSYYTINSNDNTKLNIKTASETAPQMGESVTYRVTALYVTPETAASATPEYAETDIGQSTTFTIQ